MLQDRRSEGGSTEECGCLKDKFGVSWQIVPRPLITVLSDPDAETSMRDMQAMLVMKKIDIAGLQKAYKHR